MNRIRRRVCAAVNPVSTAVTGWWCYSAIRHVLTGYGPTARQRRLIRRGGIRRGGIRGEGIRRERIRRERIRGEGIRSTGVTPSAERMKTRAAAIDQLLGQDDHER